MTTREFLEQMRAADVMVWAEGDRLRCNAPQGVLTPALQAELARRKPEILAFLRAASAGNSALVPIQGKGSQLPFFGIPGHNGDVFCYVRLAHHLGDDRPFFALQPPGLGGECAPFSRLSDLAAHYVRELREFVPGGPFFLGGYCAGGAIAYEVAQQLIGKGEKVEMVVLFDSPFPTAYRWCYQIRNTCLYLLERIPHHLRNLSTLRAKERAGYLRDRVRDFARQIFLAKRDVQAPGRENNFKARVGQATLEAVRRYRPTPFPGQVHLFVASRKSLKQNYGRQSAWRAFAQGGFEVQVGPDGCTGDTMLREPHAGFFAQRLRECLDRTREDDREEIGEEIGREKSPTGSR